MKDASIEAVSIKDTSIKEVSIKDTVSIKDCASTAQSRYGPGDSLELIAEE